MIDLREILKGWLLGLAVFGPAVAILALIDLWLYWAL